MCEFLFGDHEETAAYVFFLCEIFVPLIQDLDAEELGGNISWLPPNLTERVRETQFSGGFFSGGVQGGIEVLNLEFV